MPTPSKTIKMKYKNAGYNNIIPKNSPIDHAILFFKIYKFWYKEFYHKTYYTKN